MTPVPGPVAGPELKSFFIGPVEIRPNLILAPMSGVTGIAFRRLIKEVNPGAVGLVVTEFISVEGLTRGNEQSLRMMEFVPEERPFSIQIFGHEISRMVDAAKMAQDKGADIVDINSGCPVPKVVRKGGGCELMRQGEHLGKILSAIRKAIQVPLTLKIRSGWDDNNRNAPEVARMAQDCGVDMLTVHGRTRQALYRGAADWSIVQQIASELTIPVVGSGDVIDAASARFALSHGVAGFMVGRAALSDPWVFGDIQREMKGESKIVRSATAVTALLRRYQELLLEHGTRRGALGKLKQLSSQVTRRIQGSSGVRRALCTSSTLEQYNERLEIWERCLAQGLAHPFDEMRPAQEVPNKITIPTAAGSLDSAAVSLS